MNRRVAILFAGVAMAAALLAAIGTAGAQQVSSSPTINETPDPTWMTNGVVYSIVRSGDYIYVGGKFQSAAGSDGIFLPRQQVASFDATSGSLHPWAIPAGTVGNDEVAASLAVACANGVDQRITVAFRGPNWTRSFRLDNGNTGTVTWSVKSGGEAQTLTMLGPDKLIIGSNFSHFNEVKQPGVALIKLPDGTVDTSWTPVLTAGGNHFVSIWETFVDEDHIYIGGLFNSVEGSPRTNLARFTFTP